MEGNNEQAKYKKINIDDFYAVVPDNNMVYVPLSDYSGSDGRYCVRELYCICLYAAWFYLFWVIFLVLIPAVLFGKRTFCHYSGVWSVFNVALAQMVAYKKFYLVE